ncbi:Hypothetical predicted protein [Cloeon dipterum]|uniref:Uncharacterized protein n=1 Tax=Cloeon dipterum TaxID=197152 RepID=A0A8S1CJ26_9INSE|nr:Hypothetical predicted protein [Cloeon dipterum]
MFSCCFHGLLKETDNERECGSTSWAIWIHVRGYLSIVTNVRPIKRESFEKRAKSFSLKNVENDLFKMRMMYAYINQQAASSKSGHTIQYGRSFSDANCTHAMNPETALCHRACRGNSFGPAQIVRGMIVSMFPHQQTRMRRVISWKVSKAARGHRTAKNINLPVY